MKHKLAILFAVLFLCACAPEVTATAVPTPLPTDLPPTNPPLPTETPTPTSTPTYTPTPVILPGGYIYFTRWVTNSEGIFYRVTPDGRNLEEIYRQQEGDDYPVPSPDGQYIAFATMIYTPDSAYVKSVINVMNLDTQEITKLTTGNTLDVLPRWSADSKRIIFTSVVPGQVGRNIYAVNIDGSGLTGLITSEFDDTSGSWSPDGERIAFNSDRDGSDNIYVLELDGQIRRLTDNPEGAGVPEWSPDGTLITFVSGDYEDTDIYIINADGTGLTQLTDDPGRDNMPSWSPDGEYLVFESDREGEKFGIYIIRKDGTGLMQVVGGTKSSLVPYWIADPTL